MSGAPGAGKSYFAKKLFAGTAVRNVNSDDLLELALKSHGLSLKFDKSSNIYARQQELRNQAKISTQKKLKFHTDEMLPLVIDSTGKNFDDIKKAKTHWKN